MSFTALDAIYSKMRMLTGSANNFQIANTGTTVNGIFKPGLQDYVNSFYLYDFPAQFRSLKLKDLYTFNTIQGIDTYAFNSEQYTTVQSPCYCMHREIALFTDPWSFYAVNYNWQTQTNFTFGNGTQGPYSGTLSAVPLIRSVNNDPANLNYPASRVQNILITANTTTSTLNVSDDGNGNLIGDCLVGGTINYMTGVISNLTFTAAIPGSNPIQCQYNPVQPSIPLSIMFFQNQFTLRPVPNMGYTIQLTAYRQPTQALANTPANAGTPELNEWWETIAFGGSKKIYQDRLDSDGVNLMDQYLQQAYSLNLTRTCAQIGTQRVSTIYADQLQYNYGQSAGWFGST